VSTSRIVSVRLHDRVAAELRQRIIEGELKTGDRLPTENELSQQFGVSRNVIREAVRSLSRDGLLDVRQGSGTFVIDHTFEALSEVLRLAISVGTANELFVQIADVREIVEPGIAALAARSADANDIAQLRAEVALMDAAMDNVEQFISADHRFHMCIALAAKNKFIVKLLEPIVGVLFAQRSKAFYLDNSPAEAQAYHKRILACIENGDSPGARATMEAHLVRVREDLDALAKAKG
jgi:GntR family transcriptional repressor for pyruvate dehydrogenase complex